MKRQTCPVLHGAGTPLPCGSSSVTNRTRVCLCPIRWRVSYTEPRSPARRGSGPEKGRYIFFYLLIMTNQTLGERNKTFSAVDEPAHCFPPDTDVNKGLSTRSSQKNPFAIVSTGTSYINTEIPAHCTFTVQHFKCLNAVKSGHKNVYPH